MKKLAIIALAVAASSAFAMGGGSDPAIVIDGKSTQTVSAGFSAITNKATDMGAYALQNVSSNAGNVTVESGGTSEQTTVATWGSTISNSATGFGSYAAQSVSSNLGEVTIGGTSKQMTFLVGSSVTNSAGSMNKAIQNVASNNACVKCAPY